MTAHPAPPPSGRQSFEQWMNRNWKWVVPVGCLGPILFIALILSIVFTALKSSAPYQAAMDSVRADCGARDALGAPIAAGRFITGSVSVTGPSGHADLAIPVHGSRGSGTLYVTATKTAGQWRFDLMELAVEGRAARIDLAGKGRETCR